MLQEQQAKRQRSAHISDHRRMTSALDKCPFCFGSAARARHLTISLGQCSYLALPARCGVSQNTSGRFAQMKNDIWPLPLASASTRLCLQIGVWSIAWELCAGHIIAMHCTALPHSLLMRATWIFAGLPGAWTCF